MSGAKVSESDFPSPFVSVNFRGAASCTSVSLCAMLYAATFFAVQFMMRFKGLHNREFVECHKKAWIQLLNILHVYLYNSVNVVTVIILWVSTLLHCATLVLCILKEQKVRFFKFAMSLSLVASLANWLIHWLTRTFTSGTKTLDYKQMQRFF